MNFSASKEESKIISKIAARAVQMAKDQGADRKINRRNGK